jgi:lysophospholipase L1-like esterase
MACGKADNVQLNEKDVVLAFGDSLTEGVGASSGQDYPSHLGRMLEMNIINAGIKGQRSDEGLARLNALLTKHQPKLVILCYGGNDILQRKSMKALKDNLAQMIETIQAKGAEIILVSVPTFNIPPSPPKLYEELANQYQLSLVTQLKTLMIMPKYKSDGVHLNDEGYRLFALAIKDHIALQ